MSVIAKLEARKAEIEAALDALDTESEERDLSDEEFAQVKEFRAELDKIADRMADQAAVASRRSRAAEADKSTEARVESPAKVTNEPRTYTPEASRRGVSFLRDVVNFQMGDPSAQDRINRHRREVEVEGEIERRDIGTGAFAGLTVPQYLTDLVAPVARAGRPFADVCRSLELPADGMTVNISRVTTGSATAVQASENAATQETNMDDTLLTIDVRTIAGQQDVSRQLIDRSTGADQVVIEDLVRAYHTELDDGILNDDGTSGTHLGVRNVSGNIAVTYTDASPTVAELYPKLADLIQQVQTNVFMGVSHFVMHPRRWWWLAKEISSSAPFLTIPSAGERQGGTVGGTEYAANNRSILGVPVILDANLPTNLGAGTDEDVIVGVTASECFLWEQGGPLFIRAEDVGAGSLTVKFVVYGYSAFTAGRYPKSNGDITGTGLITPTF